jgi:hypothetical protein
VHLDGQLARGREDQAADRMQRGREALGGRGGQALQQREGEAGGLAGAGLRGGEEVAAGEDNGNGLRLDGGGDGVALLRDGTQQLGQEPEAFEGRTDLVSPERIGPRRLAPSKPVQADEIVDSKDSAAPGGRRMGAGINRMKRLEAP